MGFAPVTLVVRLSLLMVVGLLPGVLPGLAGASDDWDWDAVEEMDETPVTKKAVTAAGSVTAVAGAGERRDADTSQPDFDAPPVKAVALFSGLPDFEVIPSRRDTEMHPCANCHQWVQGNPEPRRLKSPHDNFELRHGLHGHGKFWCFTCHRADKDLGLKTLEGQPVEFADAYVVCSQCHAQQARDWAHGAHGKRVGNWQGARQVLNCTACHYQHSPAFKPREPLPGPTIRVGLPRPANWISAAERAGHGGGHDSAWQREIRRRSEAGEHEHAPAAAGSKGKEQADGKS